MSPKRQIKFVKETIDDPDLGEDTIRSKVIEQVADGFAGIPMPAIGVRAARKLGKKEIDYLMHGEE